MSKFLKYLIESNVNGYFEAIAEAPINDGIEAAEDSWGGGISDFGDNEAAIAIQAIEGYFDYRSFLEEAAFKYLGNTFVVYRMMSVKQFEAWENGDDVGPIATSISKRFAQAFVNFAGFKGDKKALKLYRIIATPDAIIMRGREEEHEIVVDGNYISAQNVKEESNE